MTLALTLLPWVVGGAQEPPEAGSRDSTAGRAVKRTSAVRVAGPHAIRVDGRLDESAWGRARWISDLRQKEPDQGAEPTLRTEVAFLYGDDALYVGARMESGRWASPTRLVTRRDEAGSADRIVISLDTFRDRRTAYSFGVTAGGTRLDWYHPEDREDRRDVTFDPVWQADTRAVEDGWTAEIRIPFSQLRYLEGRAEWGLNVIRFVPSRNEDLYWALIPRDETGWASRFGFLDGLEGLGRSRPVELLPYAAVEAEVRSPSLAVPEDPLTRRAELAFRTGLDLKVGLGPSLTLDAAVNPDFGQVDFDPAVVNLSAFESLFEEQRPFFTEGNPLLSGGSGPTLFFSRRIGAEPRGRPRGEFVSVPEAVPIRAAALVTGRLASGLSVGALAAVTGSVAARTFDPSADSVGDVPLEPATAWGAYRIQREFGPWASTAGVTGTAVRRFPGSADEPVVPLPEQAYSGKADWNLRFRGGAWELAGHGGFSLMRGDTDAITRIQRSSAHYFQRPDQDHVGLDSTRTSLGGWTAGARLMKNAGRWLLRTGVQADSPGLELNDLGQIFRGDATVGWLDVIYRETDPGPLLRSWSLELQSRAGWNFGGVRRLALLGLGTTATLPDFTRMEGRVSWFPPTLSDDLTRGGPLMERPSDWTASLDVASGPAGAVGWSVSLFRGNRNFMPDWIFRSSLTVRPAARWRLSAGLRHRRLADGLQFVTALDGGPEETFDTRYVFATARVREIAVDLRAAYAFSSDVSLDASAEPFAATGSFTRFGELAAPRSSDLRIYGTGGTAITGTRTADGRRILTVDDGERTFEIPDPDFRRLSFRTSLVLRWEWRPGSTLFVVWQGNRSVSEARDDFVGPTALGEAVTAPGIDSLILKFSYWLPVQI